MKEKQKRILHNLLQEKVLSKIILIQRWVRAKLYRCRFLHMKRSALMIQVSYCILYLVTIVLHNCTQLHTIFSNYSIT